MPADLCLEGVRASRPGGFLACPKGSQLRDSAGFAPDFPIKDALTKGSLCPQVAVP